MKSLILAVPGGVELGMKALKSSVCDGLGPSLLPESMASLPVRDDIPLLALLQNEYAKGAVSPRSHSVSSTGKVEFGPEDGGGTMPRRHAIDQLASM